LVAQSVYYHLLGLQKKQAFQLKQHWGLLDGIYLENDTKDIASGRACVLGCVTRIPGQFPLACLLYKFQPIGVIV
jgi:hypothetical protein